MATAICSLHYKPDKDLRLRKKSLNVINAIKLEIFDIQYGLWQGCSELSHVILILTMSCYMYIDTSHILYSETLTCHVIYQTENSFAENNPVASRNNATQLWCAKHCRNFPVYCKQKMKPKNSPCFPIHRQHHQKYVNPLSSWEIRAAADLLRKTSIIRYDRCQICNWGNINC